MTFGDLVHQLTRCVGRHFPISAQSTIGQAKMYQNVIHNLGTRVQSLAIERSKIMTFRTAVNHNKAAGFERRLELYLIENFKHAFDMERFGIRF
jgi:predicted GTPase